MLSLNIKHGFKFCPRVQYFSRASSEYPSDDTPNVKIKRALKGEAEDINYTFQLLLHGVKNLFSANKAPFKYPKPYEDTFPYETDILIVGGGIMGSSVAYWLKEKAKRDVKIVILEKDFKYASASSLLSMGGIRQQFSLEENIQMSLFGAHFLRNAQTYLRIPTLASPDVEYHPQGYLLLASAEGSDQLHVNHVLQKELGVHVKLLTPQNLKQKFPWINTKGIEVASYGLHDEGWFNPYHLMMAYKSYATFYGANFLKANLLGFEFEDGAHLYDAKAGRFTYTRPVKAIVNHHLPDGTLERKKIQFALLVNAAGSEAANVATMLNIGSNEPGCEIPLPVEPRKRYVYVVHCPEGPGLDFPFLIDNSGIAVRREGIRGHYLVMLSPKEVDEPSVDNKDVDHPYFYDCIWPLLANRVPCFEKLKVVDSWCGFYDYNFVDQNAILGPHSFHDNTYFINGFSGHGAQHSPAAGRAIAEHLFHQKYVTLDLDRFRFDRFSQKELLFESHII